MLSGGGIDAAGGPVVIEIRIIGCVVYPKVDGLVEAGKLRVCRREQALNL